MWRLIFLFSFLVTIDDVRALYSTDGGPCTTPCNSSNGTWWPDLVCADGDFSSTTKGQVVKQCLQCQGQSLYINGTRNDEYWFMFHMKYTQQTCLVGGNTTLIAGAQVCAVDCQPLDKVLSVLWINQKPFLPQYQYCTDDSSAYTQHGPTCAKCLQAQSGSVILGNMVETMANACKDKPLAINNQTVQFSRDLFNDTVVSSVLTIQGNSSSQDVNKAATGGTGLSAGAAAGIGVGTTAIVIAGIAALVLWLRKRSRRQTSQAALEVVPQYAPGGDMSEVKHKFRVHEVPAGTPRVELHGRSMAEADGTSSERSYPIAELSTQPYR